LQGCASSAPQKLLIPVVKTAPPPLGADQAVQFVCKPPPLLPEDDDSWEALRDLGLGLRKAYADCQDLNARLIKIATGNGT
jgi:hypothetical protein